MCVAKKRAWSFSQCVRYILTSVDMEVSWTLVVIIEKMSIVVSTCTI